MKLYWRQIPNGLRALKRYWLARIRGVNTQVRQETYIKRLVACFNCGEYDVKHQQCLECGCPVREKAKYTTEFCPNKQGSKWPKGL